MQPSTEQCITELSRFCSSTKPQHPKTKYDEFVHSKCVPGVYGNEPVVLDDLAQVVDAYGELPNAVKASIIEMVRAVK